MPKLKILSSRELKDINKAFSYYWGIDIKLNSLGYAYLKNAKNKVYAVTKEMTRIDLDQLKIDTMGTYLFYWDGKVLRLSIEGSQLFGKMATKNVLQIEDKGWLQGFDLNVELDDPEGFTIIKLGDDFVGCGRYKQGRLLNYLPKNRTISEKI